MYDPEGKSYSEEVERKPTIEKIVFKFFDRNGKRKETMEPIMKGKRIEGYKAFQDYDFYIKKNDYELAYIAEDNDPNQDSILVVLTKRNGEKRVPKLMRFSINSETGKWNKVPDA